MPGETTEDKISSLKGLMNALITILLYSRSAAGSYPIEILIEHEPRLRIFPSCYTIIMNFVMYVAPPPLPRQQPWLLHRSLPNLYLGITYHTPVTKGRKKVERNRPQKSSLAAIPNYQSSGSSPPYPTVGRKSPFQTQDRIL